MLYNLHFLSSKCRLFHNATLFGFCITHILNTGVLKFEKKICCQKVKVLKVNRHHWYSKKCISRGSHTVDVSEILRTCRMHASGRTTYRFSLFLSLFLADMAVVIATSVSVLWQIKQPTPSLYLTTPITHHSSRDSSDLPYCVYSGMLEEWMVNSCKDIWNYYFITLDVVFIKYMLCHNSSVDEHVWW